MLQIEVSQRVVLAFVFFALVMFGKLVKLYVSPLGRFLESAFQTL